MGHLPFRLMFITDRHRCGRRPLEQVVEQAVAAGLRALQLRDKDLPAGERYRLARLFKPICEASGCLLFINDRADIARAVQADGVHLPEQGLPVSVVRLVCGSGVLIGRSVHDVEGAGRAEEEGTDYILFGPVFDTPGKRAKGLEALSRVCESVRIPVVGVGGIRPNNARLVIEAGAQAVAVIGAIGTAPDISEAVLQLQSEVGERA